MVGSADEAEDAVQQTFFSAFGALRADGREIRLKPWLYTIARNRCLSILRARHEQPAEIDDVATAGLSDEVQQRSDLRELLHDLHGLPVDQRAALVLSEVGGLSHSEVGAVVGCEVAKVKSLVFQARSSLIESRRARDIPCNEIREQLATARGGALRRGPLRRHLRTCSGCAEFRDEVMRQRKALAALLPVVPTLGLKKSALAGIGLGGGGGGGAVVGVGGGVAAAVKAATAVVAAGLAVGGGLIINQQSPDPAAEAAPGQDGGGQAWPAPPAGTGPGAVASVHRAAPAHRRAAKVATPSQHRHAAASVPAAQHDRAAPQQVTTHHHTSHGQHSHQPSAHAGQPQQANTPHAAPPAPAPAPPAPAPPASDGTHGHHGDHNGNHYGWSQGVGNPHGGGSGDNNGDHHGDGSGDGSGDRHGGGHD
jgi:RNA polymerase sigma factor (sigma-70 family)